MLIKPALTTAIIALIAFGANVANAQIGSDYVASPPRFDDREFSLDYYKPDENDSLSAAVGVLSTRAIVEHDRPPMVSEAAPESERIPLPQPRPKYLELDDLDSVAWFPDEDWMPGNYDEDGVLRPKYDPKRDYRPHWQDQQLVGITLDDISDVLGLGRKDEPADDDVIRPGETLGHSILAQAGAIESQGTRPIVPTSTICEIAARTARRLVAGTRSTSITIGPRTVDANIFSDAVAAL